MAAGDYLEQLNEWHLELAIAVTAVEKVLELADDEETSSLGHVVKGRLRSLVESFPFPIVGDPPANMH